MLFMYKTTIFAQLAPKQHKLYVERGLLHLNINIVYMQQTFTSTFDNFDKPICDTSKQVITISSKQWDD